MKLTILTLDTANKNNHVYPRAVMEKAIQKYTDTYITPNRALVTRNIPTEPDSNLTDICGIITNLTIEDNTAFGDLTIFPVPNEETKTQIEEAINNKSLHLRTAGIGNITKQPDGTYLIGENYELTSMFLTDDPA